MDETEGVAVEEGDEEEEKEDDEDDDEYDADEKKKEKLPFVQKHAGPCFNAEIHLNHVKELK